MHLYPTQITMIAAAVEQAQTPSVDHQNDTKPVMRSAGVRTIVSYQRDPKMTCTSTYDTYDSRNTLDRGPGLSTTI